MIKSRFRIPTGETLALDDAGPILDAIDSRGAEFWNIGSGDAAVEQGEPDYPLALQLYFDGEDRFQLRHRPPGGPSAIARDPAGGHDDAEINVGGTEMELDGETLLSRG